MDISNTHQHPEGINFNYGKLKVAGVELGFSQGLLYKDLESNEQRACLTLHEIPNPRLVRSATSPFADVHLDTPIYVGSFPISDFKVFLLSASNQGKLLDVVISPIIDKLDVLLRPK